MANFIYTKQLGYIDLDEVVQVYSPAGGELSLDDMDDTPVVALNFRSQVFDGTAQTTRVLVRDEETINMIIAALGLLRVPHCLRDLIDKATADHAAKALDSVRGAVQSSMPHLENKPPIKEY